MNVNLNPHKTGAALGLLLGLWHAFWSFLVGIGAAKPLLDLILKLHFLNFSYAVASFSLAKAVGLVVLTTLVGYITGHVLAWSWNWVNRK